MAAKNFIFFSELCISDPEIKCAIIFFPEIPPVLIRVIVRFKILYFLFNF